MWWWVQRWSNVPGILDLKWWTDSLALESVLFNCVLYLLSWRHILPSERGALDLQMSCLVSQTELLSEESLCFCSEGHESKFFAAQVAWGKYSFLCPPLCLGHLYPAVLTPFSLILWIMAVLTPAESSLRLPHFTRGSVVSKTREQLPRSLIFCLSSMLL